LVESLHDKVRISISDNGEGIEEVFRDGLFDMFSKAALNNKKSTGLGLYLVKLALEKIGGSISLSSSDSSGSTFQIKLPLH
jgi:signal transduction histidine kinase